MRAVTVAIVLWAAVVSAQPQSKPKPADPTCLRGEGLEVTTQGRAAIVCVKDGDCVQVDERGASKRVARPAAPAAVSFTTVKHEAGKTQVCVGTVCKAAGKQVAAAIAADEKRRAGIDDESDQPTRSELDKLGVDATTDLKTVVIAGRAFELASDKRRVLKPPPEFKTLPAKPVKNPKLLRTWATGRALIAMWADGDCDGAGGCHAVVLDTAGKQQQAWFSPGRLVRLDAERSFMVGEDQSEITAIDATGNFRIAHLSDGNLGARGARVDADTIVVATDAGGYEVRWMTFATDKSPPTVATQKIATCPFKP